MALDYVEYVFYLLVIEFTVKPVRPVIDSQLTLEDVVPLLLIDG